MRTTAEAIAAFGAMFGAAPVSAALYRTLLDEGERDLEVLAVNEVGGGVYGRPAADLVGRRVSEIAGPEAVEWMLALGAERGAAAAPVRPLDVVWENRGRSWAVSVFPVAAACFAAVGVDVTANARTARLPAQRKVELRAARQAGRTGPWALDAATGEFTAPVRTLRMLGHGATPRRLGLGDLARYLVGDEAVRIRALIDASLADGVPLSVETAVVRRDGTTSRVRFEAEAELDPAGGVRRLVGTATDMTFQRDAEQALARSDDRFRALAENATDLFAVVSPDGWVRWVAPTVERTLGWLPEELVGGPVLDLVDPSDRDRAEADLAAAIRTGEVVTQSEARLRTRLGRVRYMSGTLRPVREPEGSVGSVVVSFRDVDELVRARQAAAETEAALRARTAELEEAREIAGLGVWRFAPTTREWTWSPALLRMFGLDPDGPSPTHAAVRQFLSGAEANRIAAMFRRAVATGEPWEMETSIRLAGDRTRWILQQGVPERLPDGTVVGFHGTALDITARKRADARFRETLDRMLNGCTFLDADLRITYVNEAGARHLRRRRSEVEGQRLGALHPEWAETEMASRLMRCMRERTADEFEAMLPFPDGSTGWFDLSIFPIDEGLVMIAVERTESHVAETALLEAHEALAEARRLESIGRLAGGVAHDLNNTLTAILGHAELATATAGPEAQPDLVQIRAAADRAQALSRQLLAFGRRSMLQPRRVDVRAVVRAIGPMLSRLIGEDIRLSIAEADEPVSAFVDPSMLEHALVNLVVNARDAMPFGGRIGVRADVVVGPADGDVPDGRWARIEVSDTGTGMDSELQQRIFEPFFTSKDIGRGTGLGLPMVLGFVKQSGGHVRVRSALGEGSTFALLLPISDGAVGGPGAIPGPAPQGTSAPTAPVAVASATVLVVEDEAVLRIVAERTLRAAGHTVLTAADGRDALRVASLHDGVIEVLFADLVLPGMRGTELATALRANRPGIRVLLTSGYAHEDVVRRGIDLGTDPMLPKPYTPTTLKAAIAELLARE